MFSSLFAKLPLLIEKTFKSRPQPKGKLPGKGFFLTLVPCPVPSARAFLSGDKAAMNLPALDRIGIIFDWDGVIIDSSRAHEKSWELLAQEAGMPLPPGHFKLGFGMKNEKIIPTILAWTSDRDEVARLSLRKEELYRELIRTEGLEALPGVREFLGRLRDARLPCVLGSSTHRLNISTALEALELKEYFVSIVSAEDVTAGKPDPQVFLLAADRISRPPELCIVFEDAQFGLDAALAGGMKAVGVATTHPASALKGAHRVVERMDELSLEDLRRLFA